MGFAALGGVAGVLISMPPVSAAWNTGGLNILTGLFLIIISIFSIRFLWNKIKKYKKYRYYIISSIILIFYIILRVVLDPAIERIRARAIDGLRRGKVTFQIVCNLEAPINLEAS